MKAWTLAILWIANDIRAVLCIGPELAGARWMFAHQQIVQHWMEAVFTTVITHLLTGH